MKDSQEVIRANIRKVRQQIMNNLDSSFNDIDPLKGRELDAKLVALKKQLFKQMALVSPQRDTQGDMMLRAYA